jgi:hypothetical protein
MERIRSSARPAVASSEAAIPSMVAALFSIPAWSSWLRVVKLVTARAICSLVAELSSIAPANASKRAATSPLAPSIREIALVVASTLRARDCVPPATERI